MTIFDLLFALIFISTVVFLVAIIFRALSGHRKRALKQLKSLLLFDLIYLTVVIVVALITPRTILPVGELDCSDDWCISVERAEKYPKGPSTIVQVTFLIHSRALGRPQIENGVQAYLVDSSGNYFASMAVQDETPFSLSLQPGESKEVVRIYSVPVNSIPTGIHISKGKFPGLFIINDDQSLFHKKSLMKFD